MAKCSETLNVKAGVEYTFSGCYKSHSFEGDHTFKCGDLLHKIYFGQCEYQHVWLCEKCQSKQIDKGKTLDRTPQAKRTNSAQVCENSINIRELTSVADYFHPGCKSKHHFGPREYKCGHTLDMVSDCPEDHTIRCPGCKEKLSFSTGKYACRNFITVEGEETAELFSDCPTRDHTYGPGQFPCGYVLNFNCPQKHILRCDDCEYKYQPSASSTPIHTHKTTRKPLGDDTVNMQEEIHNTINDVINEKDHCGKNNHLFVYRTQKYLSVPARRFQEEYRTCIYYFKTNKEPMTEASGDDRLQALVKCYQEVERMRLFCLEPLSEQEIEEKDLLHGYMDVYRNQLNECQILHNQFFNRNEIEKEIFEHTGMYSDTSQHNELWQQTSINQQPRVPPQRPRKPASTPIIHRDPTLGLPNQNIYSTAPPLQNRNIYSEAPPLQNQNIYSAAPPLHVPQPNGKQSQSSQAPIHKNTQSTTRPYFKLKDELDLVKKFAGLDQRKYMAFHAQWRNYIIKANQVNRSQLDLYHDLLSRLEPPAYDLCSTDYPSQDSYAAAIQTLNERYYNPSHLLRDMVKRTSKMSKMTDTYQSLLEASINLKKAKADLIQANLSEEQLQGLFLISTTEKYLSESAWREWNEIQNSPQFIADPMACFNIDNYLYAINQAMKNIHRKENALGINKPEANKFKPKSTLYGSYTTRVEKGTKITSNNYKQAKKNGKCIFCSKAPHRFQLYCKELKQKTPEQIRKIMNEHSIECAMCLVPGHSTQDCLATNQKKLRPCDIIEAGKPCNRYHCRYLHRKNSSRPNTNFTTTVKAEPTIDTNKPKS